MSSHSHIPSFILPNYTTLNQAPYPYSHPNQPASQTTHLRHYSSSSTGSQTIALRVSKENGTSQEAPAKTKAHQFAYRAQKLYKPNNYVIKWLIIFIASPVPLPGVSWGSSSPNYPTQLNYPTPIFSPSLYARSHAHTHILQINWIFILLADPQRKIATEKEKGRERLKRERFRERGENERK